MRLPRPSAPLAVSFLALFVALGGASYAAIHLPPRSVGNAQLQNFSVGNAKLKQFSVGTGKIIPGAVGAPQVNSTQVQLRVAGPCTDGAMQSIALSGNVTCTPVLPNEHGSSTAATTVATSPTQVASQSLSSGSSYLVLAYPHAVISGQAGQHVEVDCTLSVPAGSGTPPPANPTTTTKSLAVDLELDHAVGGRDDPARPAGGVVEQQPVGVRQLHGHLDAVRGGTDGHGRHDDQRDPDREQQLARRPVGCGPCQMLR